MSLRMGLLYAALLSLAAALALTTRTAAEVRPELASVRSEGGGGLAALFTWLREGGHTVRTLDGPLTSVPPDVRTLVLAAPSSRPVEAAEVAGLRAFVSSGGRLIYMRGRRPQPELDGWLEVADGAHLAASPEAHDPGGATARVTGARGLLAGLGSFRVSARRGLSSSDPHFLTVASVAETPVLLWRPEGKGDVLVAANADLAENRRVELADAPAFWARVTADGPVAFDEYHHAPPAPAPLSLAPFVFAVQAVLCALLLALTRGTPLGPPRSAEVASPPTAMAYAESFGRLLRVSRVESELVRATEERLRRALAERAGVSLAAPADEVGPLLRVRQPELARAWEAWRAAVRALPQRISAQAFRGVSRRAATVELCARGLRSGG
ncbi:MAG: DUF4350 domain-containing protein [Deltaproteobacteria bacterium]|nr:DUF4350 domain-containing protein [Deltaproteobacteria bacterium]